MTHLERLECSTDGPISRQAKIAALRLDMEAASRRHRTFRVLLRLKGWQPKGMIEAMAKRLVDCKRRNGCACRMDLVEHGFTHNQVDRFGYAAVARAYEIEAATP